MILHDLNKKQAARALSGKKDSCVVAPQGSIHPCTGCFGCWLKTPGVCVIPDDYQKMGSLLARSKEVLILSRCIYGGFSPFIKNVLDRSISYIHPYFRIRNKEMHHRRRYPNSFELRVCFYGDDITEEERATASALVEANALNFYGKVRAVDFLTLNELMEGSYVKNCFD